MQEKKVTDRQDRRAPALPPTSEGAQPCWGIWGALHTHQGCWWWLSQENRGWHERLQPFGSFTRKRGWILPQTGTELPLPGTPLHLLMSQQGDPNCPRSTLQGSKQSCGAGGGDGDRSFSAKPLVFDAPLTGKWFPPLPYHRLKVSSSPQPWGESPLAQNMESHKVLLATVRSQHSQALPFSRCKLRATKPEMRSKMTGLKK